MYIIQKLLLCLVICFSCNHLQSDFNVPEWYLKLPEDPGFTFGAGDAIGDERLAIMRAIDEISRQYNTVPFVSVDLYKSESNKFIGDIKIKSKIISSHNIDEVDQKDSISIIIQFEDFTFILNEWDRSIGMDAVYGTNFYYETSMFYPSVERVLAELDANGIKIVERKKNISPYRDTSISENHYFVLLKAKNNLFKVNKSGLKNE
jgi:hypothetical protein